MILCEGNLQQSVSDLTRKRSATQDAPTSSAKQPRLASASAWFLWFPLSLEITKADWKCLPASKMRPWCLRHSAKRLWITPR